ncbi:hypothetical protein GCM10023090_19190 [Acidovorax lacteus]|uniref:DUF4124 domain-containing protein n=1 Tax=Acidovorax lacteus TaxID=1924988 RepID=A0ABP8LAU4_9BURK
MGTSARIIGAAVWATLVVAEVWAQPSSSGIFTCVDRNGRRITADRPIPECADREQKELSPSGTVRRQIGPTLTEVERAELEQQRRREAEERNRQLEERRRERALLARYPDKAAHDAERAAALSQIDDLMTIAHKRIGELQAIRKGYDTEMEFYKKDPTKAPVVLRRRIAENEEDIAERQRYLVTQEQEKRRVHQRFDAELATLQRLWEAQRMVPVLPLGAPPASGAR